MERNNSRRISFSVLLLLLILSGNHYSFADSNSALLDPFPSLRHGIGAKALAMGGTGVVNAWGAEAILWNPSMIITREKVDISIFTNQVSTRGGEFSGLPYSQYFYVGATYKLKNSEWLIFEKPTIGAALYYFNISGLSVIGVDPVSAEPLTTSFNDEGQSDILFVIPFATNVLYSKQRLSLGFNFLTHYHTMFAHTSEIAFGWDMGVQYRIYGEPFNIAAETEEESSTKFFILAGARFRHLGGIEWVPGNISGGYTQNGWNYLDIGTTLGFKKLLSWMDCLSISYQLRYDENEDYHLSTGGEIAIKNYRFRMGMDNIKASKFKGAMVTNNALTFGIGFWGTESMNLFKNFHLDYCFRMYLDDANSWMSNENNLTLGYSF